MNPIQKMARPFRPSGDRVVRVRLLVDPAVQQALLVRFGVYAAAAMTYFAVIHLFSHSMLDRQAGISELLVDLLDQVSYWAPGLLLLVPLAVQDLLRLTNRFAGPKARLARQLRELAAGDTGPLEFRRDDYWQDLADDFNRVREELLRLRDSQPEGDGSSCDGATGDGASIDGATGGGVTGGGVTGDGATGDGATGDGVIFDGASAEAERSLAS